MPTIMQFESGIVNVWTAKRSGLGFFMTAHTTIFIYCMNIVCLLY